MIRIDYRPVLMRDPRPVPLGDIWLEIPEPNVNPGPFLNDYTLLYQGKVGRGNKQYAGLAYASFASQYVLDLIAEKGMGDGNVTGPATGTVIGNFAIWADTAGTLLLNGPAPTDFATAAQGSLADTAVQPGDPLTVLSSGAAPVGQVPEADGAGGITWAAPPSGGGDVVGPASSTDDSFAKWDGITGDLLKDGVLGSTGGNGALDAGKVALYGSGGQLFGNADTGLPAIYGITTGSAYAGLFSGGTTNETLKSISGGPATAIAASSESGYAIDSQTTDGISIHSHTINLAAGNPDLAEFTTGLIPLLKLKIKFDGGLEWGSTGAQTTATNLPAFGALTKGVVPAAGAVPAATNFLTETGVFAVPAGTGVPTSRTISTTAPLAGGGDLSANRTLSIPQSTSLIDGFLAAADWVIFNAKQAAISFGTGVLTALGVNVGTAGSVVINGGALGTPSSGTLTNCTGLPIAGGGTGASTEAAARSSLLLDRYSGVLTADQTFPSTTLADITSLSGFSLAAGATYHFTFNGLVNTSATTVGILVTVNASAAISSLNLITQYPTSATAWSAEIITALQGGTVPTAGPGATNRFYTIAGSVTTSGACTFAFQARSEDGTTVTVKRGSNCLIVRTA